MNNLQLSILLIVSAILIIQILKMCGVIGGCKESFGTSPKGGDACDATSGSAFVAGNTGTWCCKVDNNYNCLPNSGKCCALGCDGPGVCLQTGETG